MLNLCHENNLHMSVKDLQIIIFILKIKVKKTRFPVIMCPCFCSFIFFRKSLENDLWCERYNIWGYNDICGWRGAEGKGLLYCSIWVLGVIFIDRIVKIDVGFISLVRQDTLCDRSNYLKSWVEGISAPVKPFKSQYSIPFAQPFVTIFLNHVSWIFL